VLGDKSERLHDDDAEDAEETGYGTENRTENETTK
jgi:hypothetical protein